MAALHPRSVRRLVVLSMAHPRRLRAGMTDPAPAAGVGATRCAFQVPRLPERMLTRADDDPVADLLQRWAGPAWARTADFAEAVERYRAASRIPQAAYGAMEYHRWAARSQLRPDGLRYARRMAAPITAPTLQLHGELDTCVLPQHRARLRAATSPAPTSGGSCPASGTSRRRRRRTPSAPRSPTGRPPEAALLAGTGADLGDARCCRRARRRRPAGRSARSRCWGRRSPRRRRRRAREPSVANSGPPELPARTMPVERVDVAHDGLRVAEVRAADLAPVADAGGPDVERPAARVAHDDRVVAGVGRLRGRTAAGPAGSPGTASTAMSTSSSTYTGVASYSSPSACTTGSVTPASTWALVITRSGA